MEHKNAPEALYKVNTGLGSNAVADQNLEQNLLLQEGTQTSMSNRRTQGFGTVVHQARWPLRGGPKPGSREQLTGYTPHKTQDGVEPSPHIVG